MKDLFKTFYYIIIYMFILLKFMITRKPPSNKLNDIENHIRTYLDHLKTPKTFITKDGMKANIVIENKLKHKLILNKKGHKLIPPKGKTKYQDYASLN